MRAGDVSGVGRYDDPSIPGGPTAGCMKCLAQRFSRNMLKLWLSPCIVVAAHH